ncbi:MAG: DUF2007 domain-containing protein [Thiobacillus sp.]|nr:DUF2007 domain-containing protein [Thiobacillus sp.]
MKRVHIAPTLIDAQLAADLLGSLGIPNHIFNVNAAGALGEVPFVNAQPEIWVDDDSQAARAREILARHASMRADEEQSCPHCGETNPAHFLSCWHCGNALAGRFSV